MSSIRPASFALMLLIVAAPKTVAAQLQGPSARALGMAGSYTLAARGFEAPSWNPAVLALPGRARVTFGLPQGALEFGSNAYGFRDVVHYAGARLTEADKDTLLSRVDTTLRVQMAARVNPFGLSIGRFAVALSSAGEGEVGIGKDAVDLALHGNAARSGPGEFFTANHSNGSGWAITTLALSGAWPIPLSFGQLSLGATAKREWGRGLARAAEIDSRFGVNPTFQASGSGHAIYTTYPAGYQVNGLGLLFSADAPGSGYGVDLGGALQLRSGLTVGLVIVNAVGGMSWKTDRLRYERADLVVGQDANGVVSDSTIHTALVGAAIEGDLMARALRDSMLSHASLARLARAGVSYRAGGLLISGDVMVRLTQGLDRQPAQSASTGLEYVLWGVVPLRTGIGTDFAGSLSLSVGTGLYVGPVRLDLGAASVSGPAHHGVMAGVGLSLAFGSSGR